MNYTNNRTALVDLTQSIANTFKKYSRQTRKDIWKKITDDASKNQIIDKIILNPERPLEALKKLSFKEWLENNN